jgi:hypothetical protein
MGIRFLCQACGHKLNVKAFLAGKRGICPKCGAKVNIPKEEPAASAMTATPIATAAQQATANRGPMAVPVSGPGATAGAMAATPRPMPAAGSPAIPTATTPMANPTAPTALAGYAGATPHGGAIAVDPVGEAPNAVWYVRPSSGGQFGPASGDVMRRWIAEGRVSSDSMVWREGWPDWKNASETFPSLGGVTTNPMAADPVANTAMIGESSVSRDYRTRPRRSNGSALAMVVLLTIMSIGLLVALVVVVAMGGF